MTPTQPQPSSVKAYLLGLQQRIVSALEEVDGQSFGTDGWQRPEGGGIYRIIENGNVFERGGVGFSHVMGKNLPPSAAANRPELAGRNWEEMGVSLVLHPHNPYAPTVHMNVRFFTTTADGHEPIWWFGGGMDLTPYYGFEEDARHFHQTRRLAQIDQVAAWQMGGVLVMHASARMSNVNSLHNYYAMALSLAAVVPLLIAHTPDTRLN